MSKLIDTVLPLNFDDAVKKYQTNEPFQALVDTMRKGLSSEIFTKSDLISAAIFSIAGVEDELQDIKKKDSNMISIHWVTLSLLLVAPIWTAIYFMFIRGKL